MRFEGRDLKPYAEAVSAETLKVGETYFSVQFIDVEMFIPELEALVFTGTDIFTGEQGTLCFQDAESYRNGIRFDSVETDEAVFYSQRKNEVNHIFEYEKALDLLLACSLRRRI